MARRTPPGMEMIPTWADVLAHVASAPNGVVHYWPPMDHQPRAVRAEVKGQKVRIRPFGKEVSPFTADKDHLDRFVRYR